MSNSILGYALTVARDREQGVFQRIRVTPAPSLDDHGRSTGYPTQAVANLLITVVVVIAGSRIHHISLSAGTYGLVLAVSILGGAVFLSIGQALVGLIKSADSINAAGRVLTLGLVLLASLGQSGTSEAPGNRSRNGRPSGVVMTLFTRVPWVSTWEL